MPHLLRSFVRKMRPSFVDRRRSVRRKPGLGVTCQLLLGGAPGSAGVVNLSEGGACLTLRLPLSAGRRLSLRLFNRACLRSLTAEARVVWCGQDGDGFRAGLQFVSPVPAGDLLPFLC